MTERLAEAVHPVEGFDLNAYLQQRSTNPNFIMIEIGHGAIPAVEHQAFRGHRAYIGIESGQRFKPEFDALLSNTLSKIKRRKDENIFFHKHDTGYRPKRPRQSDAPGVERGRYGRGKVKTIFPHGAADEVYVNNVFGDPQVGVGRNAQMLLKEIRRLIDDDGRVVIRETLSPKKSQLSLMSDKAFMRKGFKVEAKYVLETNPEEWNALERTYMGNGNYRRFSGGYYLVLSKAK